MKICVIDCSKPSSYPQDDYFNFKGYTSYEDGKWRSYHSFTACLETEFFGYNGKNFHNCYSYDGFILTVDRDIHLLKPFIQKLKLMGKKVAIAYHEGSHMLDLNAWNEIKSLKDLCQLADFYLNVNFYFHQVLEGFIGCDVRTVQTTAPLDKWYFPNKFEREGIMVLTRTFNQSFLKRNSFKALSLAVLMAKKDNTFVSYINEDGLVGEQIIKEFFGDVVKIHPRQSTYMDWLNLIAKHKFAFQMDMSNSVGQTVLDCWITRTPCKGGNCDYTIQQETNPHFSEYEVGFETTKQQLLRAFQ